MAKRSLPRSQVAFAAAAKAADLDETDEHRGFPRIETPARFSLWIGEGSNRQFAASLRALNLSVSGAFLQSSFFLPIRTELRVSFALDDVEEPVQARAQIVREQRADSGSASAAKTGFGIRFLEFYGQSEVTLAKLFLGPRLRAFVQQYLQSKRARTLENELERTVDTLAAWELLRVTTARDPWRP
ncbi:MAG TPA: PilZ domain-containing protein [Myxococcaceae bacterium]|nr:PilZ domain-containing protein [Myxococcaceae bacterium]